MFFKSKFTTTIAFLADILLLLLTIYVPEYIRNGNITFNMYYALLFITWTLLSFIFGKYHFKHHRLGHELTAIILNSFAVWGLLSLFIIFFQVYMKNYDALFLQILFVTIIELTVRIIYFISHRKNYSKKRFSYFSYLYLRKNSWGLIFLNLLWIFLAFMFLVWLKPATLRIYIPNYYPFLIGLLIWEIILNLLTGKHKVKEKKHLRDILVPTFRANVFTFILLAIIIYLFHLFDYSRLILFGTVVLSTMIECGFAMYISLHAKISRNMDESEKFLEITPAVIKEAHINSIMPKEYMDLPSGVKSAKEMVKDHLFPLYPELYSILEKQINLNGIRCSEYTAFDTQTIFNIVNIANNSKKLIINIHKVNDFKHINDYFSILNKKIETGGYYIGTGKTIKGIYRCYLQKYPQPIGRVLYFFHFLFHRVLPKMPVTREISYFITRGKDRTLSKTEILGRMVFCGFKIIKIMEEKDILYFIAAKVNTPSKNKAPQYGPIISLKRTGKDGNSIWVYKFRTMHPYAEFLHDYFVEFHGYDDKGKVKDDFRVTPWGKIFRKLWLDELPQLVNLLRGDLALVGVRPLSKTFLNEYPEELKQKRFRYRPGCIPPYVALKKQAVEEYIESERIYLEEKEKHPHVTDFKYFWLAVYNIITNKIRSQ